MTLAFMALLALVIGDRVDARAGRLLLAPLSVAGAASVVAWRMTGDLRAYGLVQFLPTVAVPLLLVMYRDRAAGGPWLWAALTLYALAKVAEAADGALFAAAGVSGHTIKHVAAAGSVSCVLAMLVRRSAPAPR
jgi:hypothetical protein